MKVPMATNPFPPVEVNEQEEQALHVLVQQLLESNLADYEHFRNVQRGHVDARQWKLVRRREDVSVYKERRKIETRTVDELEDVANQYCNPDGSYEAPTSSNASDATTNSRSSSTLPVMLTVGTIAGTLEDTVFGIMTTSTPGMRIKTSYLQDNVVGGAVLATLVEPTETDPFRSMNVKWVVKGTPKMVKSFVRQRDLIYVEATGIVKTADGERIGYQVKHSLDIPQCRELKERSLVRGKLSLCCLFRETKHGCVDIYLRGIIDPLGDVMENIAIKAASEVLVSFWKATHASHMRKLGWFLRNNPKTAISSPITDCCNICAKGFGTFTRPNACQLCQQNVCSRCTVKKKLAFLGPNAVVCNSNMDFCVTCISRVSSASAFKIASQEQAQLNQEKRDESYLYACGNSSEGYPSFSGTCSSSGSMDGNTRANSASILSVSDTKDIWSSSRSMAPATPKSVIGSGYTRGRGTSTSSDITVFSQPEYEQPRELPDFPKSVQYSHYSGTSEPIHNPSTKSERELMFMQMMGLCQAAENAYQITQENNVLLSQLN